MIDEQRSARRLAGWSQRTLAETIGVDPQTIKRLERGGELGSEPASGDEGAEL